MSKYIATRAIRGAYSVVGRAEEAYKKALADFGPDKKVDLPNTGYYLPVIYAMSGEKVETVGDMDKIIKECKKLLPPHVAEQHWLPYLGNVLDSGMATLWAAEIIESLKYIYEPIPYVVAENSPDEGNFWLGAADDIILRKRGIEFVDGTAPGFAACVGAAPTTEAAVKLARELQEKNLYVFMAGETDGKTMAGQLREGGVQMGWETRLVPFGKDITAAIFALGFASRAAMAFGGVKPGDFRRNLIYNKNRVFAFVLALGDVDDEKFAHAAGAINYGFPAIADTDITQILPTGVCTYEHVVSPVPIENMVAKAIEVRGLKVQVTKVPVPVSYGPAFEGERIRKEDLALEINSTKQPAFEVVYMKDLHDIEDGKINVIGPEINELPEGSITPLGIEVLVAGRDMQSDFEPILERQIHHFINQAQGVMHMGQRDLPRIRISKETKEKGFKIRDFGVILHAKLHAEFNKILDKVEVNLYTAKEDVAKHLEEAKKTYRTRDERIAGLTDETVDIFYSCTLCQSFAPNHVCVISPERTGLCGSVNWLDGKAGNQMNPTGVNQPIRKDTVIDPLKGQWKEVNEFVYNTSRQNIETFNAYSIMEYPMTSCGCFECIAIVLPLTNGVMTVNREFNGETPCGMKFTTLAGSAGGGLQTPGVVGHSKRYICSKKFIMAEGGIERLVWMPKILKDEIKDMIDKRGEEIGHPNLYDLIADETVAKTEEEVLEYIQKVNHPVLNLPPLM